jgi:polyisoprenoid-binding protein YceI
MAEATPAGSGVWKADPMHTQVEFATKHLGMMTVRGHFADVSIEGHLDPENPIGTSLAVTIQTSSVSTHNEFRDNDIRSDHFLDVEHFPTITFTSTHIEPKGKDHYEVTGDLTIKGITKPVTLVGEVYGEFNDPRMGHRIAYSGQGKIDRREYGLTLSPVLDGKFVVGNEVDLIIEGEIVEQKPELAPGGAGA